MADESPQPLTLVEACQRGNIETVRRLLDAAAARLLPSGKPASHNPQSSDGHSDAHPLSVFDWYTNDRTPLFHACEGGHIAVVSLILDHPLASPAAITPECLWAPECDGDTPFIGACKSGCTELVSMLMRRGGLACTPYNRDSGNNAVVSAVVSKSVAMLELVAPLCPWFWRGEKCHQPVPPWNPMAVAAREGSMAVILWLLDRINPQYIATSVVELPPLCEACLAGRANVVALLLRQSGVDATGVASSQQFTPLHHAVRSGNAAVVRLLLADPRVNPNTSNRYGDRRNPLTWACSEGFLEVAQALAADPRVNVTAKATRHGWSVFGVACDAGQAHIIKWLATLDGVNPCERVDSGWSGLHAAVQRMRTAAVEALLQILPPDACTWRDVDQWLPLHVAAYVGSAECLDLLLRHGGDRVDVNALCKEKTGARGRGVTALHLACSQSHPHVAVRLLADKRVDPSLCRLELVKLCKSTLEQRDYAALRALVGSGRIDLNVPQGSFTYLGTELAGLDQLSELRRCGPSRVVDGVYAHVELLLADERVDPCAPRGAGVSYPQHDKTRVDECWRNTRGRTTVWSSDEGIVVGSSSGSGSDGYVTVRDDRAFMPSYWGRGKSARPWPRCLPPLLHLALLRERFEETATMKRLLACPSVQASAPAVLRRALKDHAVRIRFLRLRRARFPRTLLLERAARKQSTWLRRRTLLLVRMMCHTGRASSICHIGHAHRLVILQPPGLLQTSQQWRRQVPRRAGARC